MGLGRKNWGHRLDSLLAAPGSHNPGSLHRSWEYSKACSPLHPEEVRYLHLCCLKQLSGIESNSCGGIDSTLSGGQNDSGGTDSTYLVDRITLGVLIVLIWWTE